MPKKKPANSRAKESAAHRQALYVEAMVANGGNKRQAALTAGAKSDIAADQYAARMSQNVTVTAQIEARRAEVLSKAMLTTDEVLQELAHSVRFDPARMYGPDGALLPIKDMPPEIRRQLDGIETQEMGTPGQVLIARVHKVKHSPKVARMEQAMKHLGLFEKDNAQKPAMLPPVFNLIGVRAK